MDGHFFVHMWWDENYGAVPCSCLQLIWEGSSPLVLGEVVVSTIFPPTHYVPDVTESRATSQLIGKKNSSNRRVVGCRSGNPLFLEPYWRRNAAAGDVVLSPWHRLGYITTDGGYQSAELERLIRRLHKAVGNAVVDDKHIVFGTGSIQLVNALVHALSPGASSDSRPARVVATAPYYAVSLFFSFIILVLACPWKNQILMHRCCRPIERRPQCSTARSTGGTAPRRNGPTRHATPNNPDTLLYDRVLAGSAAIVDHAYYWPYFTHIPAPADEDVMLFTASKLSGHAGSRFGWVLSWAQLLCRSTTFRVTQLSCCVTNLCKGGR
jgi:hypothetical protein